MDSLTPISALHVPAYLNPPQVCLVRASPSTAVCLRAAHKYYMSGAAKEAK